MRDGWGRAAAAAVAAVVAVVAELVAATRAVAATATSDGEYTLEGPQEVYIRAPPTAAATAVTAAQTQAEMMAPATATTLVHTSSFLAAAAVPVEVVLARAPRGGGVCGAAEAAARAGG